jgi:hypothetical protein
MPPKSTPPPRPQPTGESKLLLQNILIMFAYVLIGGLITFAAPLLPSPIKDTGGFALFGTFFLSFVQAGALIVIGITNFFIGNSARGKTFLMVGLMFVLLGPFATCISNVFLGSIAASFVAQLAH